MGLDNIDKMIHAAAQKNPGIFLDFHGIGESTALSLIRNLNDPKIITTIQVLKKLGFNLQAAQKITVTGGILENTVWAVTGSFTHFKPREKALQMKMR